MHSLSNLTPTEIDQFISKCRRSLASQAFEIRLGGDNAKDMTAATQTTLGLLQELLQTAPASKRPKIQALLNRHGIGLPRIGSRRTK